MFVNWRVGDQRKKRDHEEKVRIYWMGRLCWIHDFEMKNKRKKMDANLANIPLDLSEM